MDIQRVVFVDGLLWYLETRNWAFEKIASCPRGSHPRDIKMHHYLYFSNLLGAVDLVDDFLKDTQNSAQFVEDLKGRFSQPSDYRYVRELRNAIVHRGFDPASAGHANDQFVFTLCPTGLHDRKGAKLDDCSFRYTIELATHCNSVTNRAIRAVIEPLGFLDAGAGRVEKEEILSSMRLSSVMPDWAKALAEESIGELDFEKIATDVAETRARQLRELLDIQPVRDEA